MPTGPAQAAPAAAADPAAHQDDTAEAAKFGRVDADGTVYVKVGDGERAVGSWQAGDAEAGLAHYALRYADLAVEADLLERRLETGSGDPKSTRSHATKLRESLGTATVVGDLAALDGRLGALIVAATAGSRRRQRPARSSGRGLPRRRRSWSRRPRNSAIATATGRRPVTGSA